MPPHAMPPHAMPPHATIPTFRGQAAWLPAAFLLLFPTLEGAWANPAKENNSSQGIATQAKVVDARALVPLADVEVLAFGPSGVAVAVTDDEGVARFPTLALPSHVDPLDPETWWDRPTTEFHIEHPGFLPQRRQRALSDQDPRETIRLVPADAGLLTGPIDPAQGARMNLPGLGFLRVEPGTLAAPARLRLISVPHAARSWHVFEGVLAHQLWVGAEDTDGMPLPNAFAQPTGISLVLELPPQQVLPAGYERQWRTHHSGFDWEHASSTATFVPEGMSEGTFALEPGFNLAGYLFEPITAGTTECVWSPWQLNVTLLESGPLTQPVSSSVNCGIYANAIGTSLQQGETVNAEHSLSSTVASEIGWSASSTFAKIGSKVGASISGSLSSGISTTTMTEAYKKTSPTGTVNGQEQASLSPPWNCITGVATYGVKYDTYVVAAMRRCVTPWGTIKRETKILGNVNVPKGLSIFWNVSINPDCDTDCEGQELPELPI